MKWSSEPSASVKDYKLKIANKDSFAGMNEFDRPPVLSYVAGNLLCVQLATGIEREIMITRTALLYLSKRHKSSYQSCAGWSAISFRETIL